MKNKVALFVASIALLSAFGTSAYAEGGDRPVAPLDGIVKPLEGGDRP